MHLIFQLQEGNYHAFILKASQGQNDRDKVIQEKLISFCGESGVSNKFKAIRQLS